MIDDKLNRIENGLSYLDQEIKSLKRDLDQLGRQIDQLYGVDQRIREMVDEIKSEALN